MENLHKFLEHIKENLNNDNNDGFTPQLFRFCPHFFNNFHIVKILNNFFNEKQYFIYIFDTNYILFDSFNKKIYFKK